MLSFLHKNKPEKKLPTAVPAPPQVARLPVQPVAPTQPGLSERNKAHEITLYKSLLSGLYDGILIFDAKGSVIGSNQRAELFLGYTETEVWGMACQDLVAGINTRMLHKLHEHAQSGRFTVVSATCKRKDGTTFPAEIAISRIRLLQEGDLIFSIRNLERREKAREGREMSDEAVRGSGAGIAICSTDGIIKFVNPALLKLLDMPDEATVLRRMIGDFCTSDESVRAMIHSPSAQGVWQGTIELRTPKGLCRKVLLVAALSAGRHGAAPHLVLTMIPLPMAMG
jgi:PAS domain S-box-containing protein